MCLCRPTITSPHVCAAHVHSPAIGAQRTTSRPACSQGEKSQASHPAGRCNPKEVGIATATSTKVSLLKYVCPGPIVSAAWATAICHPSCLAELNETPKAWPLSLVPWAQAPIPVHMSLMGHQPLYKVTTVSLGAVLDVAVLVREPRGYIPEFILCLGNDLWASPCPTICRYALFDTARRCSPCAPHSRLSMGSWCGSCCLSNIESMSMEL